MTANIGAYYQSDAPLYIAFQMEDQFVSGLHTSSHDVLHKPSKRGREFRRLDGDKLTMAEFYLDTFVAYWPQYW